MMRDLKIQEYGNARRRLITCDYLEFRDLTAFIGIDFTSTAIGLLKYWKRFRAMWFAQWCWAGTAPI
jgi:hypothetical protein